MTRLADDLFLDSLAFIKRTRTPLDPERGPAITTTSVVDFDEAGDQVWFQVQDGAYPAVLSPACRRS